MEKIVLIGAINKGKLPKGGDEYKNQELLRFLPKYSKLSIIDTIHWKKKPFVIFQILYIIYFSKNVNIWLSTSTASAHRLFSFLHYVPYPSNKKISYLVIGGLFSKAVLQKRYNVKYFHRLHKIIVEGKKMKEDLLTVGLQNVETIPNFKNFKFIPSETNKKNKT